MRTKQLCIYSYGMCYVYLHFLYYFEITNCGVSLGNKIDLRTQRTIHEEDGRERGEAWRCQYFESSALYNLHVDVVFEVKEG